MKRPSAPQVPFVVPPAFVVKIDTREQTPFAFPANVATTTGTLTCGDYSVVGLEHEIGLERKSIGDLVGSITSGNARFQRALERLHAHRIAAVIIEGTPGEIEMHRYFAPKIPPSRVFDTIATLHCKHRVPFMFGGTRAHAAAITHRLLYKYWLMRRGEQQLEVAAQLQAALTGGAG